MSESARRSKAPQIEIVKVVPKDFLDRVKFFMANNGSSIYLSVTIQIDVQTFCLTSQFSEAVLPHLEHTVKLDCHQSD